VMAGQPRPPRTREEALANLEARLEQAQTQLDQTNDAMYRVAAAHGVSQTPAQRAPSQ
jgi:transcriptional regulator GlxA family with amidase domain